MVSDAQRKEARTTTMMVFIVVIYLFLVFTLFRPVSIVGDSMSPTFENGGCVHVNTLAKYDRGDVVIFNYDGESVFIKRVVAIGGDKVSFSNGAVFVNGKKVKEPYIHGQHTEPGVEVRVPKGSLYVLGDNREVSYDSREIGCVRAEKVIGKVWEEGK